MQSVKNTDMAGLKGYDAGKKVSGIKRHIAADTQGLPHAVEVSTAEVTNRKALRALARCKPNLMQVKSVVCDSGYLGQPFAQGVCDTLGEQVTVQIAKRSDLHTFKVMPKRWVVKRSFAWLADRRGKTASARSILTCSSSKWHSRLYCSKDFDHVLRNGTGWVALRSSFSLTLRNITGF